MSRTALLSNPALRKMDSAIFINFFDNGDGLLACRGQGSDSVTADPGNWSRFRLLLTDSGHYLLPVDHEAKAVPQEVTKKAASFWQQAVRECRGRWNDVRHCFLSTAAAEHERSEVYVNNEIHHEDDSGVPRDPVESPAADDRGVHRDPVESPAADDRGVRRDPVESPAADDRGVHSDPVESPAADDRGVHSDSVEQSADVSGPSLPKSPSRSGARGIYLLSAGDPKTTWAARDEWTLFGDTLIRHHNVPRRTLFTTSCVTDCPVPVQCLGDRRETSIRAQGKSSIIKDAWSQVGHPHRDLGYMWTGQTKFKVTVDKQHPSTAEKKKQAKKYVDIPEEFYTKSKRRPELYSGSGRLSLMAVLSGLMVGFPIDYRYGWDMSVSNHQAMINQARDEFMPAYL
eukprot:s6242_g6.t1